MDNKDNLESPIHSDNRGEIKRFNINNVKFNVLFSKKGSYRSGDYHDSIQYDIILSGEVKLTVRHKNKDITLIKKANDFIKIPPNMPHLFYFVKDTVMIEWWDKPFEAKFYEPYRKIVLNNIKKEIHKF